MSVGVEAAVARAFREDWGRIVATLVRLTGDFDLAEESAQDAFERALDRWDRDGIPRNPAAWLTTAARNRALDQLRRHKLGAAKYEEIGVLTRANGANRVDDEIEDDRLRLMFTCCHPALALEARVALTLRMLAGLTTAEVARAFLVTEATMAKRLVRAKEKIRNAGIPYRVPPAHLLPGRTTGVRGVLYLLFNEGYAATTDGDLVRVELCDEAIRLVRVLDELLPGDPETAGLLALMLLHHARRAARVDAAGALVVLDEQDRSRWDRAAIDEGTERLDAAILQGRPGPYQLQAAIAACHATADDAEATDWRTIAHLYGRLREVLPTPVVALNEAVAVAMADGPSAGLVVVDELDRSGELAGYHLLPATRADLLRRLGRHDQAAEAYRSAIALAPTAAERAYLERRLEEVTA